MLTTIRNMPPWIILLFSILCADQVMSAQDYLGLQDRLTNSTWTGALN